MIFCKEGEIEGIIFQRSNNHLTRGCGQEVIKKICFRASYAGFSPILDFRNFPAQGGFSYGKLKELWNVSGK